MSSYPAAPRSPGQRQLIIPPIRNFEDANTAFRAIALAYPTLVLHQELVADAVNGLLLGRANNTFTFTLTANSATTTISQPGLSSTSRIFWMPTTANAAAAMTNLYVSARTKNGATLTHANTATVDRTFDAIFMG